MESGENNQTLKLTIIMTPWDFRSFLVILTLLALQLQQFPSVAALEQQKTVLYTVLAPKTISPHSTYQVRVILEPTTDNTNSKDQVSVNLALTSNTTIYYKSASVPITPGSSELVPLVIRTLDMDKQYNLTVEGIQSELSIFTDFTPVQLQKKTSSIFIQTDKVIYKPGETVRFRVIVLDRELKPIQSVRKAKDGQVSQVTIDITIKDSRRNVIKQWKGVSVIGGLFSSNLTLSAEPVLGDWTITVAVGLNTENKNEQKSHTFSVDQYILPKFNVEIILPPYVTFNNSKVNVQVKASYTYGKPVGSGDTIITISDAGFSRWPPPQVARHVQLENGVAFAEFDLVKDLNFNGYRQNKVSVKASVLDKLSGKRQNGSSTITIYQHPYKLQLLPGAENYRPGFPVKVTVKVTTHDDLPVADERPDALLIEHGFSYEAEGSKLYFSIPPSGLVTVTFKTPTNEGLDISGFTAIYKGMAERFFTPSKITSKSKTYLHLTHRIADGTYDSSSPTVPIQSDLYVKVECNRPFHSFYYQLVHSSFGQLLNFGKHTNQSILLLTKESEFVLKIPAAAVPSSILIVYVIADDESHEIIADSLVINTVSRLNNHLNLSFSSEQAEPGDFVQLNMSTRPSSLVALRGVDQSVLLLKEDRDLDLKVVDAELEEYDQNEDSEDYSDSDDSFAYRVFNDAGILAITSGKIYKPSDMRYGGYARSLSQPCGYGWGSYHHSRGVSKKKSEKEIRVRTHFPETWLWEEVTVLDDNGSFVLNKTVPDTLTSWFISAYSIHSDFGLGILEQPQKLTVVRPFFLTLNVPYSAVKGEVLAVQVLVHNYLGHAADVEVTLDNSKGHFLFADQQVKRGRNNAKIIKEQFPETSRVATVSVGSSDVQSVTFVIIPSQFGTIELAVKGTTTMAGDALSRPLIVKPPGQQQTVNKVALLDHRTTSSSQLTLETVFPENRVDGADKVRLSLVADILGPAISNLDDLLKMPYGCGEQNMVNFVPDLVILDYLTTTGSLTPEIKAKALRYLEAGYQRQLTYIHDDGSFSAFGKSDTHGSTWLTAFVIKSFHGASRYITIDKEIIRRGLEFLVTKQLKKGMFKERGNAIRSGLQGGSGTSGRLALSAYTLITLIETKAMHGDLNINATLVVDKALEALVSELNANMVDVYGLILTAFALELAKHPKRDEVWLLAEKYANMSVDGEYKYWEHSDRKFRHVLRTTRKTTTTTPAPKENSTSSTRPPIIINPTVPTAIPPSDSMEIKPISVEMTAYELLIYLHKSKVTESLPIVKWLLSQLNPEGGFKSTQDTVVGLTALAKFAGLTRATELNLSVVAKYNGDSKTVEINHGNSIVLQSYELPNTSRTVDLKVTGSGMALVQLTNTFYVESNEGEQAFTVDITVTSPQLKELRLAICTSFYRVDRTPSNMAVLEINLPTGYVFDTEQLDEIRLTTPKVMRIDPAESDSQLNIYFDSLNSDKSCVNVHGGLLYRVANQAPSYVLVYDYYDTTRKGKAIYEAPKSELCELECGADKDQGCIAPSEQINCI